MTFDSLRGFLRVLFWTLLYLGMVCGAILVFARAGGLAMVGWVAVLYVIGHDAHGRFGKVGA